jgi:methionyl-tRNA synthetase
MNLEGDKMSTSRGWSIEMEDYINDWIKKDNGGESMADVLRYYLTTISPETKDSEFTWKGFQEANNSELVNIFGNFVNRAFVLMHKLCKGKVPVLHADIMDDADRALFLEIQNSKLKIQNLLEEYKFRDALFEVIDLARKGNRHMQDKQPWIVARQLTDTNASPALGGQERAQKLIDNCLHVCLQLTANLAIFINPFLPSTAKKLCYMMKVIDKMLNWENGGKAKLLSVGYSLREPQLLFRKIEDGEIAEQIQKLKLKSKKVEESKNEEISGSQIPVTGNPQLETSNQQPVDSNTKPQIVFDDFAKIDLKVGTIIRAEKVEKADKLLKLQIDLGFETRTIVSGIAVHFKPEEIVGRQVTVVANLAPRKMRGIESNGMILMAEDKTGKLHFINPETKIDEGSGVS